MTTNKKYSNVLLELKTHYQQTLAELEAQTIQIKARLTSIDTLIDDPLLSSDLLSILQGEAKPKKTTLKASPSSGKRKFPTSKKIDPKNIKWVEPKAEVQSKGTAPKASLSSAKKKSATPKKTASQAKTKKKTQKKTSSASSSSRPMQRPYTEMYKIDAIATIMQENAGNSVHIDDLILQLYGELGGDDLKTERKRIKKSMYDGVRQNQWRKDPKESMSYIFEEKSQGKSKESKTAQTKKSLKKT